MEDDPVTTEKFWDDERTNLGNMSEWRQEETMFREKCTSICTKRLNKLNWWRDQVKNI